MTDISNPTFHDEDKARAYLEAQRWPDGPFCPYCGDTESSKPLPPKGSMGKGWYHCRECRRKYTVRVGTLFERSHVKLHKWLLAMHLMCSSKKGMSAHQLHRMLGVTYKTAWFMSHRIREAMRETSPGPLGGSGQIVEVDETFIGIDRDKKPKHEKKGRGYAHKHKVLTLVERGGKALSMVVDNLKAKTLVPILREQIDRETMIMTDEAPQYRKLGEDFAAHRFVSHGTGEYGRGPINTNTIEGFFSIFKRGMKGVYQHCGKQHLHRYVAEFDFRYNHRKVDDWERTDEAPKGIEGRRLTYRRTSPRQESA